MTTTHAPLTPMYPVFLKLEAKRCVVVGGGPIGAQKARELAECGAELVVISPVLAAEWDNVAALAVGSMVHHAREFEVADVLGAFLVISATADPVVDEVVYNAARAAGAIVNVVDVPHRCDYYAGSVVRRGPVTVAIGTSGVSPSLAIAIRRRVEALLPDSTEALAAALNARRDALRARFPNYRDRATRLNRAVDAMFTAAAAGCGVDDLAGRIDAALHCPHDCGAMTTCCAAFAFGERT